MEEEKILWNWTKTAIIFSSGWIAFFPYVVVLLHSYVAILMENVIDAPQNIAQFIANIDCSSMRYKTEKKNNMQQLSRIANYASTKAIYSIWKRSCIWVFIYAKMENLFN